MGAMSNPRSIVRFPTERTGHPARYRATVFDIAKARLREWVGRLANWLRIPGAIQPTEIHDKATGQNITVAVGALFVRLTVNQRDFYFDRVSGRFDGTGSGAD
jgi:hypothetical protein